MKLAKKMIFLCIIYILSTIWSVDIVDADRMEWHKPAPCFGCHGENLNIVVGSGGQECPNCHNYIIDRGKLNVEKLEDRHDPKICKRCHIGNTVINGSEREIFHAGHEAIDCIRCHTSDNMTVIKIQNKNFECVSCHGNKIHSIHINNLGKACPICHGSWAQDKIYKPENTSSRLQVDEDINKMEKFTIFNMLKSLLKTILG